MRAWLDRKTQAAGAAAMALLAGSAAHAAPVLMISIDGLRPADVLDAKARGLALPTLTALAAHGTYASEVRNALPTVTYPNHTTLITGVWPAAHGIASNETFDPLQRNMGGWYWYASDIKVPTLWDAVHAKGEVVASLGWPVSVGARSIDENLPEYWRAKQPDDLKLIRALATPGLPEAVEAAAGAPLGAAADTTPEADEAKAKFASAIYRIRPPAFFTLHLSSLDHVQHETGPGSPQSHAALERIDADVAEVVAAARKAEPNLVVAIVSDHGFAPLQHEVNLYKAFAEAGLITLAPDGRKAVSWEAEPWGGASAAVVLARPDDPALRARVKALLDRLAADPQYGINRVIDQAGVAAFGGTPMAAYYIDFKLGYEMGANPAAPTVSPSVNVGMHGYFPDHPEMHSTFIIEGPGVAAKGSIGEIDMRDIAPTLAKVLGVALPSAQGEALF
jgi:predicted AlkP superfamily pyrophosphatase or phosphodiesterase